MEILDIAIARLKETMASYPKDAPELKPVKETNEITLSVMESQREKFLERINESVVGAG